MKKIIMFLIFSFASHSAFAYPHWKNLDHLDYRGLVTLVPPDELKQTYTKEQIDIEIILWTKAINKAIASIDSDFFRNHFPNNKIKVTYFIDDNVGFKAFFVTEYMADGYLPHDGIYINLFRDVERVKSRVDLELIDGDGYLDESERTALFMHELGRYTFYHLAGLAAEWFNVDLDDAPTKAAENYSEDFADSFFLYAIWPEYLEINYKERYDLINSHIGDLFCFDLEMPSSIRSMLRKEHEGRGKECGEGKLRSVLRTILFFLSVSLLS